MTFCVLPKHVHHNLPWNPTSIPVEASTKTHQIHSQTRCPLPTELLNEIIIHACASSAITYSSLVRVSRRMRQITELRCLAVAPIILTTPITVAAFCDFLHSSPEVSEHVRHLWISSDTKGIKVALEINHIIRACKCLRSLACEPRALISICGSMVFRHTQLRELMLLQFAPDWKWLSQYPSTQQLFNQLTHFQMANGLGMQVPGDGWFQRLQDLVVLIGEHKVSDENIEAFCSMHSLNSLILVNRSCSDCYDWGDVHFRSGEDYIVHHSARKLDLLRFWCEGVQGKPGVWGIHGDAGLIVQGSYLDGLEPTVESFRRLPKEGSDTWEEKWFWFQ